MFSKTYNLNSYQFTVQIGDDNRIGILCAMENINFGDFRFTESFHRVISYIPYIQAIAFATHVLRSMLEATEPSTETQRQVLIKCASLFDEAKGLEILDNDDWPADLVSKAMARDKGLQNKTLGFVYLLRSESGAYKIGRTKNPEDRIKTFSVKLPFQVNYELVIEANDHYALEKELHTRFQYCRLEGEWFDLTEGDIADLHREFSTER